MPKGYHHLTYDQRCQIYALLKRKITQIQIAQDLKISQSTISKELSRNKGRRGYRYKQAHQKSVIRNRTSRFRPKMNARLSLLVENLLCNRQWSPEQISGHLKQKNIFISHESIYRYVWRDKKDGGMLYKHLRNRGKKYHKRANKLAGRGMIPNRVGIEKRPLVVERKERVGDFELDTIVGAKHRGAIVSVVERKTKLTRLDIVSRATAKNVSCAITKLLQPINKYVHTLTSDNGKEFAQHKAISDALKADFYFGNPYHSWERGLNENTNRLIRQYFPKSTDFATITKEQVKFVEYLLNTRPRKLLNFKTPIEVFCQLTKENLNYALRC